MVAPLDGPPISVRVGVNYDHLGCDKDGIRELGSYSRHTRLCQVEFCIMVWRRLYFSSIGCRAFGKIFPSLFHSIT